MSLRPYQQDANTCIHREWESVTSTLVDMATGLGKTELFSHVIKQRLPGRSLVICNREELVWQAREKIERRAGVDCGIEMAELYVNDSLFGQQPVVVSTVQTLNSQWGDRLRMGRFKPTDFDTLVCDECHFGTAPSFRRVFDYFKQNPRLKILGVTATPDRADEESLGQVFDTVAYVYEIETAIADGWLVPIYQQFVSVGGLDFSDIRTTAGDLNGADLANVMEAEKNMQGVVGSSIDIIGSKRALLFACSVKQAEQACEIFNRHKSGMASWICGATNKDDRRSSIDKFKSGETQVMCNCGVLTHGYDDAGIEVIIGGRPTKSRALYAQMAGRGTRPLSGIIDCLETAEERVAAIAASKKPGLLLLDFAGNSGKHKLITVADILGGKVSDEAVARAILKAKKDGGAVRMDAALSGEEEALKREIEAAKKAAEQRKVKLVAKVKYSAKSINPFDAFDIQPVKARGWDSGHVLSEKQSQLLMKQGINPDSMSYAEGKQVLNEMFRRWSGKLATLKQCQLLKRYGYDTKDMTMDNASQLITSLKGNGWKMPATPQLVAAAKDDTNVPF